MKSCLLAALVLTIGRLFSATALGDQAAADQPGEAAQLALQLHNPVATLISVPIENDWDFGGGPAHAMAYAFVIKPVIPFSLSPDWNLITRTIVPFIYVESPVRGGRSRGGLGDIAATIYLSPDKPMGGWFWGAGPGLFLPSATDPVLGSGKWSAGPTAALLRQDGGWTSGALTGHAWSFAGSRNRDAVSTTFLQPFVSYTTKKDTTFGVDTASEYDWTGGQWTVPVEASISQVLHLGRQDIEVNLTGRYYAEHPADSPRWGLSFTVTFMFPEAAKTL